MLSPEHPSEVGTHASRDREFPIWISKTERILNLLLFWTYVVSLAMTICVLTQIRGRKSLMSRRIKLVLGNNIHLELVDLFRCNSLGNVQAFHVYHHSDHFNYRQKLKGFYNSSYDIIVDGESETWKVKDKRRNMAVPVPSSNVQFIYSSQFGDDFLFSTIATIYQLR